MATVTLYAQQELGYWLQQLFIRYSNFLRITVTFYALQQLWNCLQQLFASYSNFLCATATFYESQPYPIKGSFKTDANKSGYIIEIE